MTLDKRSHVVAAYIDQPTLDNRNELIDAHRYLCARGARKFYRGTVDRSDLEQIAALGLIKACERYSNQYETPFEAFAWLTIVGELMHFVRDHERLVRIPRSLRALDRRFVEVYEDLMMQLEREPNAAELSREIGVASAVIDELRALRLRNVDLERTGLDGREKPFSLMAPASEFSLEDRVALEAALAHLSDRELVVLRAVFVEERTQADVGRELGVSQRQVSRYLARTLERLARLIAA